MTALTPNETGKVWQASHRETPVLVFLSEARGDAADLVSTRIAGFGFSLNLMPSEQPIALEDLAGAPAAVVQVDADNAASLERFRKLVVGKTPIIAALYDPPLKVVRELILAGAHDVMPLPIENAELERSLSPIRAEIDERSSSLDNKSGKIVAMLKAVGGVGATSLLTQTAISFARKAAAHGREACLIDFDVQFGDAAFQLGMRPTLSVGDLIEAGSRVDGDFLRVTSSVHASGLRVIAAPPDMIPLESLSSDLVIDLVTLAAREFGTVFVDLPSNWTNWSLSLAARADVALLVTEMSVSSLHRARRQLDLLRSQDLGALDVRIVVNRMEKGLMKSVRLSDVHKALGRDVSFTIANDHPLMRSAIDRGVPLSDIKSKSALGKDIEALAADLASILGQEG
ncbi:MAG: hypothetical protein ABI412_06475 [Sphingomicrobium sp.]